jgi:flagellar basal-body rod protein FlgF
VLSQAQARRGAQQPDPALTFPVMRETVTDYGQGGLQETGRNLDFAIEGEGFFRVRTEDGGIAYTRDGQFQLSPDGTLTDSEGRAVLDAQEEPLRPGSGQVTLNEDGAVYVPDRQAPVGRVAVYRAEEPGQLAKQGDNLFTGPADNMVEAEAAAVRSGFLERSNVNTMREMVHMLDLQRSYQAMTKAMRTLDETFSESGQRLASSGQ